MTILILGHEWGADNLFPVYLFISQCFFGKCLCYLLVYTLVSFKQPLSEVEMRLAAAASHSGWTVMERALSNSYPHKKEK